MRYELILPQEKTALLFPLVSYNIPGLFQYSDIIYHLIEIVNDKFSVKLPIKYLYGSPNLKWNSGRLIKNQRDYSIDYIHKELIKALDYGIKPLITCSNQLITKEDLLDIKGNEVLKLINEINGSIIVVSPILKQYIQDKYKNIEIHASVIITSFYENRDIAFYEKLSKEYEFYVIHPDDNFDLQFLSTLPKNNAEIIINERCVFGCSQRKQHYESIAKEQMMSKSGYYADLKFLSKCNFIPEYKQEKTKFRNISLSIDELKKINELGFNSFKLQGRTDNPYVFLFDLLRYTLESQVAFPTVFPIMSFYLSKYYKL